VKIESADDISNKEITILKPNQKFTYYKEGSGDVNKSLEPDRETGKPIQPLTVRNKTEVRHPLKETVNVEPVVSWKENRWIFEQESLSRIAVELERRFDVVINIESERLKTYRFTGILVTEPIDQVLKVMSVAAPISYKLAGRVITLSENKNFVELNKNLYNR
jgi:ferric-dicitrate binding protein FerR (iron transport regulator)